MPRLVVATIVVAVIAVLLARSAPRGALKDGLGRSRRSRAIWTSSVSSASPEGRGARGSESARSRASASLSVRDSSLMGIPHPSSQGFERAKLELLHRAFAAPERLGDLAQAALLDEAGQHDTLLVAGQASDQVGEHGAAVGVRWVVGLVRSVGRLPALARQALPAVGDGVARDLEEPGGERHAAPFEAAEVGERLVEHLGGQVLGLAAAAGARGARRSTSGLRPSPWPCRTSRSRAPRPRGA